MTKIFIAIAAAIAVFAAPQKASAQDRTIPNVVVTAENGADGRLVFDAAVTGQGVFTIELIFNRVTNGAAPLRVYRHVDGCGPFYQIPPNDVSVKVKADFEYNWLQGELNPPAQPGFVYRLPYNAGVTAQMTLVSALDAGRPRGNFRDFRIMQFDLPKGEPVYAMRRGLVISATNNTVGTNSIVIQHHDGTMAEYMNIAGPTVNEGDTVAPDTVIGKAGEFASGGSGIRTGVYFFETNTADAIHQGMARRAYIDPVFITKSGNKKLVDGDSATAKVTRKVVNREKKVRSRLFVNM